MDKDFYRFATEEISFQERAKLYQFYADAIEILESKGIQKSRIDHDTEFRLAGMEIMMKSENHLNGLFRVLLAKINNHIHDAESWKEIAKILARKGLDRENCIYYFIISCRIQEKLTSYFDTVESSYYAGLIFYQIKEYQAALEHLELLCERIENVEKSEYYIHVCNLISTIYLSKNDIENASKYADLAISAGSENGDLFLINSLYSKLNGRLDSCLEYSQKALKSFEDDKFYIAWDIKGKPRVTAQKRGISSALSDIGSVYQLKGEYDKSLDYLFRSLKVFENLTVHFSIGSVYAMIGNREKMLEHMDIGTKNIDISKPHHQILLNAILLDDGYKLKGFRNEILEILLRRNLISHQMFKVGKKIGSIASVITIEDLLASVADGNLMKALQKNKVLNEYVEDDFINQTIGRLKKLELDNSRGILGTSEYNLEYNKIQNGYIKFLTNEIKKKRKE